jgi:hypothetical protein
MWVDYEPVFLVHPHSKHRECPLARFEPCVVLKSITNCYVGILPRRTLNFFQLLVTFISYLRC